MPQTYEPTFFLLKRRLPPSESANLLGRVIRRYQDPTLDYTPESPLETLTPSHFLPFLLPPQTDHHARLTTTSTLSHTTTLTFLTHLSSTTSSISTTTVTSPRITTRRLKREQAYFDTLKSIPSVRRKILEMCPVNDKVYLVVGTMAMQTGDFDVSTSESHERSTGVTLPLALAAGVAAVVAGGVPLGPVCAEVMPDAEAAVGKGRAGEKTARFGTGVGEGEEEVFAVACKVIRRSWGGLGRDVGVRERQPEYRRGRHFGREEEGSGSEDDDEGSESEAEVDEEMEMEIAKGLVLGDEGLGGIGGMETVFNPYEKDDRQAEMVR